VRGIVGQREVAEPDYFDRPDPEVEHGRPMSEPYRVFVVVDRDYGQQLEKLVAEGPVWIVDTPANRDVARRIWAAEPERTYLESVTTFKFVEGSSSEDILVHELDTIDDHHGVDSANPPYTIIEVIGTGISKRVQDELAVFGFDRFEPTSEGFRAIRPLPKGWSPDRWR